MLRQYCEFLNGITEFLLKSKKNVNKIIILSSKDFNKIYGKQYVHQGIVLKTTNLVQPKIEDIKLVVKF